MTTAAQTPAGRRILDAASRLFYERGITDVGVELIAEQADTTKKTLYDRFGSKDGLIVAYLEERLLRWQRHVTEHVEGAEDTGTARALAVFEASRTWLADGARGCGFINAYAELSGRSPAATAVVRRELGWTRDLLVTLAAQTGAPDPAGLGRQLALLQEGATVAFTAGGSPEAMADARVAATRLLDPA